MKSPGKLIRKLLFFGITGSGLILALLVIGKILEGGEPVAAGRVPYSAVEQGTRKALDEMAQEKRAEEQAAEQMASETQLSVAHSEVLTTLADFEQASGNLDCVRQQTLSAKLEAQKKQGISFEDALKTELLAIQSRWHRWRDASNGALSGSAEHIAASRAIVGDTKALLGVAAAYYNRESLRMCDESLDIEIYNLAQTSDAVIASFDQRQQLIEGFESEQAIKANWHHFQGTGNPTYKANIERLAQAHDVDLDALGIDLDSIAVVEVGQ